MRIETARRSRPIGKASLQYALAFSGLTEEQIEVDPEQAGPPPWDGVSRFLLLKEK